jgi:hypothetical protein
MDHPASDVPENPRAAAGTSVRPANLSSAGNRPSSRLRCLPAAAASRRKGKNPSVEEDDLDIPPFLRRRR